MIHADDCFIEVNYHQVQKFGNHAPGDVFASKKFHDEDRTICVLADGLGSGIKAHVLATMTATMAMKYFTADIDDRKAAEIILSTLPVCSKRKIGYATFTLIDIAHDREVKVIEYDNPAYALLRHDQVIDINRTQMPINTAHLGERILSFSTFKAIEGDRIITFSDGVSQSGMGVLATPLGWTTAKAISYAQNKIKHTPEIAAQPLARSIVRQAMRNDEHTAKDDITCGVVYFRHPRRLIIVTGPPFKDSRDHDLAATIKTFPGRKIICGGTTASIISRELMLPVAVDLSDMHSDIPPASCMHGMDLITEGTITLNRLATYLEQGDDPEMLEPNAAVQMLRLLLDSDIIDFIVGTRINNAHQDPSLPVELDIRRNLIKHIVRLLENKYLKKTNMQLI